MPDAAVEGEGTLQPAMATCMTMRRWRRSTASATDPPMSEPTSNGPSWTRLTSPTMKEEWVSRKTWYGTATTVSWLPRKLIIWPK